jgi:hypothetical protein
VLVKPLLCYVLSLWGQRNNLFLSVHYYQIWRTRPGCMHGTKTRVQKVTPRWRKFKSYCTSVPIPFYCFCLHGYAWFTLVVIHRRSIVFFSDRQSILHTNDHRQWKSPILTTSVNQALTWSWQGVCRNFVFCLLTSIYRTTLWFYKLITCKLV